MSHGRKDRPLSRKYPLPAAVSRIKDRYVDEYHCYDVSGLSSPHGCGYNMSIYYSVVVQEYCFFGQFAALWLLYNFAYGTMVFGTTPVLKLQHVCCATSDSISRGQFPVLMDWCISQGHRRHIHIAGPRLSLRLKASREKDLQSWMLAFQSNQSRQDLRGKPGSALVKTSPVLQDDNDENTHNVDYALNSHSTPSTYEMDMTKPHMKGRKTIAVSFDKAVDEPLGMKYVIVNRSVCIYHYSRLLLVYVSTYNAFSAGLWLLYRAQ